MVTHDHDRYPVDSDDPVVTRTESHESESILQTIVRAVAIRKNVPATELDPLYEQVDVEALQRLLTHAGDQDTGIVVEFSLEGYRVVVSQDETVSVHDSCRTVTT